MAKSNTKTPRNHSRETAQRWQYQGWHYFQPAEQPDIGRWMLVVNVGHIAIGNYFRAFQDGGYYNIEDFGKGTWYGPFPSDPAKFMDRVPSVPTERSYRRPRA